MYRNKKDIDKHVENLLSKLSPKEFNSRAHSIARLYYDVGDYINSKKYVEQYLGQKDNNAAAHRLLAQTLQKLGQKEKAFEELKRSLDLDPSQTSLLLEICELLSEEDMLVNSGRAKYWLEKAEGTFPRHPTIFRLREKLVTMENSNPQELINLLKSELTICPKDASLHARLLKQYINNNNIKEGFEHGLKVEFEDKMFYNNFGWYETLGEMLKHNSLSANDWQYQLMLLTVLERLLVLSINETPNGSPKSINESIEFLQRYDEGLKTVDSFKSEPVEFHAALLQHHKAQFAFHLATLMLKKAKKGQLSWKDATKFASPLLLICWHTVPLDVNVNWLKCATESQKNAVNRWYLEGCYRCSQSGHYLMNNIKIQNQSFLDSVIQFCSTDDWKLEISKNIAAAKTNLPYFTSNSFSPPKFRLPTTNDVEAYDAHSLKSHPSSLHNFIWILLNYKDFADFKCDIFDTLAIKSSNYQNCGPETLNKLDVLAFLYLATFTAQQRIQTSNQYHNKPEVLPANITDLLCTFTQMKWWDCAYKLCYNKLGSELTDIRVTLSQGIEVIRCVDSHGLDPELLCKVARVIIALSKRLENTEERTKYESRASLYYSSALFVLEKLKNGLQIRIPDKRLFDYMHKELGIKQINKLIEESKVFIAIDNINKCQYEKAVDLLLDIKSPDAYYHLCYAYKSMAYECCVGADSKTKFVNLLTKAKNYAFKALDRIKELQEDVNHPLFSKTQEIIEDIETQINAIDLDSSLDSNEIDTKYYSDDDVLNNTTQYRTNTNTNARFTAMNSTPRQQINNATNYRTAVDSQIFEQTRIDQKSLERIESQLKTLQSRESTVSNFIEQFKSWFDENRNLSRSISSINENIQNTTEQFKQLKISVDQVKEQNKNDYKEVSELKKQVAELRKEVTKLKKSSDSTMDENDLYNLEEEFKNEAASNFTAPQLPFNTAHVIPALNPRLVQPFTIPPNPYQLYGQNLYNLYNQYAQFPQTPTMPIPQAPLFDPARSPANYPGVFPTPDQVYPDMSAFLSHSVPPVPPIPPIPVCVPSKPALPISLAVPSPVASKPTITPVSTMQFAVSKSGQIPAKDTSRPLPVNVVITASDPLPTCTSAPQPILSVTIPPKHIKGIPNNYQIPHNYQIPMPVSNDTVVSSSSVFDSSTSVGIPSQPTSNWNMPNKGTIFGQGANNDNPSFFDTSKYTQQKAVIPTSNYEDDVNDVSNTSLNKSRTLSERSNTSTDNYDPCPDFKPIIPLPDEVKVNTGEENELPIFSARAKLYRFVDKQWKERGVGEIKLLKHNVTEKVRVLMRRDQIHKICANHIITPEMDIQPMKNETKAYIWVANDFADETVVMEKFCVRFKTPEIAKQFYEKFEKSRSEASSHKSQTVTPIKEDKVKEANVETLRVDKDGGKKDNLNLQGTKTAFGGFTFKNAPTFKILNEEPPAPQSNEPEPSKANVFSSFTFKTGSSSFGNFANVISSPQTPADSSAHPKSDSTANFNSSDTVEEFEPNVEFKPVVPLPALVEQKSGEEDEIILFEHRAKLLRFITATKEWKERGLGNMKLLVHKDNSQKLRLLMRREQVMKVCCNHSVTKSMKFEKMPNMDKAVTWCAKDFSEGELTPETFCLRFKTVAVCDNFLKAVTTAQEKLTDESKSIKEEQNAEKQTDKTGFGDKFKPKSGSWQCDACYTNNLENFLKCACCEQPKPGVTVTSTTKVENKGIDLNCTAKFNFGIPQHNKVTETPKKTENTSKTSTVTSGWGDKFKPKEGSWECKQCFVRNDAAKDQCLACNSYKNPDAAPKNNNSSTIFGDKTKFSFGIPTSASPAGDAPKTTAPLISEQKTAPTSAFSFGIPSNNAASPLFGVPNATGAIFAAPKKPDEPKTPINLMKKDDQQSPGLFQTPTKAAAFGAETSGKFEFVFKPKNKSPVKSPRSDQEEESDNEYVQEEENQIHFSPVVPLPNKIEVVTGEEDELELYAHRAKLFRFANKEWKERGLGIIKILKHKITGKLRVLMRREQILKICLNHALTPEIEYKPKDEKSWYFTANDYSEGDIVFEQFCIRFQNKDVALEFKKAIDNARGGAEPSASNEDDDDVVFVSEVQSTLEDKKRAKELMLPDNFFNYKSKAECQGCRGCEKDDETVSTPPSVTATFSVTSVSSPVSSSPSMSIYGTPALNKTANTTIFGTPLGADTSQYSFNSTTDKTLTGTFDTKNNSLVENKLTFGTPLQSNTSANKSAILAAPKLNNSVNTLKTEEPEKVEPKSIFATAQSKFTFGQTIENKPVFESKPSETKSIFGSGTATFSTAPTGLAMNQSIFAAPAKPVETTKSTEVKSLFGADPQKTDNIFGSAVKGSLFGPASLASQTSQPANIFSGTGDSKSIFGSKASSVFGSNTSLFAGPQGDKPWTFGSQAAQITEIKPEDTKKDEDVKETPFKVDESLSFASLSSKTSFVSQNTQPQSFKWEGAGSQLFNVGAKDNSQDNSHDNSIQEEGAGGDAEYDPHYDPIVPLPDIVEVLTGEEDEERLYSQRCKLYRFDTSTSEWKERGVGDLKILYHPQRKTYRFLMRREQVYKAVLNMLLYIDLELLPMKHSDRAWTMVGQNFAENPSGENETLTVRFKTVELANAFRDKVVDCVRKLQAHAAQAVREEKEGGSTTTQHVQEQKPKPEVQPPTKQTSDPTPLDLKPLRLPKHLADSSRADSTLAMTFPKQADSSSTLTFPKQVESSRGDSTLANGSRATKRSGTNGDTKAVTFQEPEDENADDEEEEEYDEEAENYDYENNYEDYADYEEEESSVYYATSGSVHVTQGDMQNDCGVAQVQVVYDNELYSPKILITDPSTGEILADMLIHTDTEFKMDGNTCSWWGMDYTSNAPIDKEVIVDFGDPDTAMQFYNSCETSKAATYSSVDPES